MVCIDSDSNRLVLKEKTGITEYEEFEGRTLDTIKTNAVLLVAGIGTMSICRLAMHVPKAAVSLLATNLMSDAECIVSFGKVKL